MFSFFKKEKEDNSIAGRKNWYEDRYQSAIVQRNFLALLIILSLLGIISSTYVVISVTSSKDIEPFVIEIEEKTGITNVIRPWQKEQFKKDQILNKYFIMKYLNARETYDINSLKNNTNIVRLLSTPEVYAQYRSVFNSKGDENPTSLAELGVREIKVRSYSILEGEESQGDQTVQVRFNSRDVGKYLNRNKNLIATISFEYTDFKYTNKEREVNPLGFQVIRYRTDEETLTE